MLKGESFIEYKNLFSLHEYKTNGKIISKYFHWWKSTVIIATNTEYLKTLKYHGHSKCDDE